MSTKPPSGWAFEYAPSNPKQFLSVCRLLAEGQQRGIDDFVDPEVREWLQVSTIGSNLPMHLYQDAYASLINRLSAPEWLKWLEENQEKCKRVGDVLRQLQKIVRLKLPTAVKVSASLVARRLIQFLAAGIVDISKDGIGLLSPKKPVLPPPWDKPSQHGRLDFKLVSLDNWRDFVAEVERFWSSDQERFRSRVVSTVEELEAEESRQELGQLYTLERRAENILGISGPLPRTCVVEMETDEESEEIILDLPRGKAMCFAAVSAMQTQLAQSHREIPMAIKLLHSLSTLKPEKLNDEHLRDSALTAIVIMTGVPAQDLLHFGLGGNITIAGSIGESGITIHAGSGFYPSLKGRIPAQEISLGMPILFSKLITEFISRFSERDFIEDCFPDYPLDRLLGFMAKVGGENETRAKFLHRSFIYVAARMTQVQPGILALILGRPVGPYRSASNYLSSSHVIDRLHRTQRKILELAQLTSGSAPEELHPPRQYGVSAPSLGEAVINARKMIGSISTKNQAAAALDLVQAVHCRRPTLDKPSLDIVGPFTPDHALMYIGDKNNGGGRRLRLVPMSSHWRIP